MKEALKFFVLFGSVVIIVTFTLECTENILPYQRSDALFLFLLWPLANCIYLIYKIKWVGTVMVFTLGMIGAGMICALLSVPLSLVSHSFASSVARIGGHSFRFGLLSIFFLAILGSIFNDKIGILPKKK